MSKLKITGVVAPPVVPFTVGGDIDEKKLRQYINWLIEKGVNALFSLGSFGGGPLLSIEERKRVAELNVEAVDGRIPVICQIGHNSTCFSVELAKHAEKAGLNAIAVLPPGYYKHTTENIKRYFQEILNSVDIPVYLYNNPGSIGYSIAPELLAELAEMGLSGIKDSSFDLVYFQKAMNAVDKEDFNWINGTAPLMYPSIMLGADACVLGPANAFPELAISIWNAIQARDYKEAEKLQKKMVKLCGVMNLTTDVVGVHEMIKLRGFDFGGYPRRPLLPCDEKISTKIKQELEKLELI